MADVFFSSLKILGGGATDLRLVIRVGLSGSDVSYWFEPNMLVFYNTKGSIVKAKSWMCEQDQSLTAIVPPTCQLVSRLVRLAANL